jgi:DNA-binding response OmpR family regulator
MKEKILILDDDKDILEILTLILTESGYEILSLSNGKKIFDEIKNFEPNLILMDVMLGDMDGLAICKAIKEKFQYKDLPVILISATHDMKELLHLQGAPNGYLEKPFDIDVLLSTVKKNLKLA